MTPKRLKSSPSISNSTKETDQFCFKELLDENFSSNLSSQRLTTEDKSNIDKLFEEIKDFVKPLERNDQSRQLASSELSSPGEDLKNGNLNEIVREEQKDDSLGVFEDLFLNTDMDIQSQQLLSSTSPIFVGSPQELGSIEEPTIQCISSPSSDSDYESVCSPESNSSETSGEGIFDLFPGLF